MDKKQILIRLREVLDSSLPGQWERALLFGSRVRGNSTSDSDLDILVVIKGCRSWNITRAVINACYAIDLEFDVVTDIKVIGTEELNGPVGRQRYIQNALEYGVAA